jgi:rhodanese-related sulfurtransferase
LASGLGYFRREQIFWEIGYGQKQPATGKIGAEDNSMDLFDAVKNLFAKPEPVRKPLAPITPEPDPEEIKVPELTVANLRMAMASDQPPLLLDVRERYEWDQVRIADALHIPMNRMPDRLADLPRDRTIVVFCAHGSRSFGVTHFLREQGFDAYNLAGGITQWHIQGGPVEVRTGR